MMADLTQIVKERAERMKNHKYMTPLPFDKPTATQSSVPVATAYRTPPSSNSSNYSHGDAHYSNDSSSSDASQSWRGPAPRIDAHRGFTDTQRHTNGPKHVPLHKIIDFRASRSRQQDSQSGRGRPSVEAQHESKAGGDEPKQNHSPEHVVRDGVPHTMTRHSTVMVESVEGVPLTASFKPNPIHTIPEIETEMQRAERLTEMDDMRLEAEFEQYQRRFARDSPKVTMPDLGQEEVVSARLAGRGRVREVESALWTKKGWEKRMKQETPKVVNRRAAPTYVA